MAETVKGDIQFCNENSPPPLSSRLAASAAAQQEELPASTFQQKAAGVTPFIQSHHNSRMFSLSIIINRGLFVNIK